MNNIQIIPIFDQSAPLVWADFGRIHASTMRTNYDSIMCADEILTSIESCRHAWKYGTHFAFGAYSNNEMVGFIKGTARGRCATIQSLYVLHNFQKKKVGHRLLEKAESAVSLFANRVQLIALANAEPFYQAHGYQTQYGTNAYEKTRLPGARCVCLPVFRCTRALESKIQQLDSSFKADMVNKQHQPVFAYFNVESEVIGFSVGKEIVVSPSCGISDIIENNLRRNLAKMR